MVAKKKPDGTAREPKDLRYRNQYFPGADGFVFDTGRKGFVPLPIILRKILWYLTPPELRVLIYLILRASKYGICYPTLEEIAYDLGMKGRKNLTPHLRTLETKHFIKTHTASGKKFFLIHDPRIAIERLAQAGEVSEERFSEINDLLCDLHQEMISKESAKSPVKKG
jgi:DNA-binding MarR family transcriptional regulator